ncbi:MAG TPA: peptidylprolyl isomerase [Campylobacteraceae bacterium]|jgi:peptidyl-prolyl cis-trans isomerase B (cyclophilin B)|nr:peptidylprolyl isomerase [Campylobacteraceae bacterium]
MSLKEYDISEEALKDINYAIMHTSKGEMKFKLYKDEAPNTVANFAHLAKTGFYDNLKFHRVIPGFMAQGGCPHGTGTGGPGWAIKCETSTNVHKHVKGTLSMAHAGPNTGGSQFFICFVPCPHLDGVHTVFGGIDPEDKESMAVLDSIQINDTIKSIEIV